MKQLQQANSTTLSNYNYNWMKSEHVTYEFLDKVVDISEKLGVSPDDLMAVMAYEANKGVDLNGDVIFTPIGADGM